MFARFETGKATDDSVPLDGDDMAILAADDPLAPLHRYGLVAAVVDRDVVDKGMRLIARCRKLGSIKNPEGAEAASLDRSTPLTPSVLQALQGPRFASA